MDYDFTKLKEAYKGDAHLLIDDFSIQFQHPLLDGENITTMNAIQILEIPKEVYENYDEEDEELREEVMNVIFDEMVEKAKEFIANGGNELGICKWFRNHFVNPYDIFLLIEKAK